MKKPILTMVLCLICLMGNSQNYRVTFTGTGESSRIDWIKATNLVSGESVVVKGDETLTLSVIGPHSPETGLISQSGPAGGMLYPNPFNGNTTILVPVSASQTVYMEISNLSGQQIVRSSENVQGGQNEFSVTLAEAGIYFITVVTNEGIASYKALCSGTGKLSNTITHLGSRDLPLKGAIIGKILIIRNGDIVEYACASGSMTTIFNDKPENSGNFDVKFSKCTDWSGRSYSVINLGEQTWMAENLAWLPGVNKPAEGSFQDPAYYVYGYQGGDRSTARSLVNYQDYGVLYNWKAARTACPEGWRLPNDKDWATLEKQLGMSTIETEEMGWRESGEVGIMLKEPGTTHWKQACKFPTEVTAFNARPAGYLPVASSEIDGLKLLDPESAGGYSGFYRIGMCNFYWSSSEYDRYTAWNRRLGCSENGVERRPGLKSYGYSVRCIKDAAMSDIIKD